jgi:hypothetical protein
MIEKFSQIPQPKKTTGEGFHMVDMQTSLSPNGV